MVYTLEGSGILSGIGGHSAAKISPPKIILQTKKQ